MNIKLYSDGACSGNPGPGGWGCILSTVLPNGQVYEVKHSAGYRYTTNNRMELAGVIEGLSYIKGIHNIEVITDSKYVCDAFNQNWIDGWRKRGWKKSNGPLLNPDMWRSLWNLVTMHHNVKFTWIKGHNNNPYNEECDRMAVMARQDIPNLMVDVQYEKQNGVKYGN